MCFLKPINIACIIDKQTTPHINSRIMIPLVGLRCYNLLFSILVYVKRLYSRLNVKEMFNIQ